MSILKISTAIFSIATFTLFGIINFASIQASATVSYNGPTYAYVALCKDQTIMKENATNDDLVSTKVIDGTREIYGFGVSPEPLALNQLSTQPCQLTGVARTYPEVINAGSLYMYKVTCNNPLTSIAVSSAGGVVNPDGSITFPVSASSSFVFQNFGVGQISYIYGFGNSSVAPENTPISPTNPNPIGLCMSSGVNKREAIRVAGQYMYEVVCNNIALQYRTRDNVTNTYTFSRLGIDGSRHIIGFGRSATAPAISRDPCGADLGLASVNVWKIR